LCQWKGSLWFLDSNYDGMWTNFNVWSADDLMIYFYARQQGVSVICKYYTVSDFNL